MVSLSFRLSEEMKTLLEGFSEELGRSKAHLIRQALSEYFEDFYLYKEAKALKAVCNTKENMSLYDIKKKYDL